MPKKHSLKEKNKKPIPNKPQKKKSLLVHLFFLLFNCCLRVDLQLDKGNYPKKAHVVFCPNSILLNLLCVQILLLKGDGELQAHNITHLFYSSVLRVASEVAGDR